VKKRRFACLLGLTPQFCITIIGRSRHLVRGPGANGAMVGMCTEKRHPYDRMASHFTGLPASGENQKSASWLTMPTSSAKRVLACSRLIRACLK